MTNFAHLAKLLEVSGKKPNLDDELLQCYRAICIEALRGNTFTLLMIRNNSTTVELIKNGFYVELVKPDAYVYRCRW